ncbi:putative RNA helicase [Actinobacillus pleuropneumoniae]|nr:putative RNA helicase [Actinobacillus pleuropneumoniae]KIE99488.1 putative RNA helicase [Actinobacillus pleuropneumoniae]
MKPSQKNFKNRPLDENQKALIANLKELTNTDYRRLRARIHGISSIKKQETKNNVIAEIEREILSAQAAFQAIKAQHSSLEITYPDLPVSARREEILKLIAENQVVVIAGETGSGKTTQLPKMCLELGRGVKGLIGHTQPRRLAARSVANRIAEELKSEMGATVGYKVRFNDQVGENTLVKLMTDGILLAEIQNDRYLNQYDTLIIDEAHERSLNNDFILGYLKQILHKRLI